MDPWSEGKKCWQGRPRVKPQGAASLLSLAPEGLHTSHTVLRTLFHGPRMIDGNLSNMSNFPFYKEVKLRERGVTEIYPKQHTDSQHISSG